MSQKIFSRSRLEMPRSLLSVKPSVSRPRRIELKPERPPQPMLRSMLMSMLKLTKLKLMLRERLRPRAASMFQLKPRLLLFSEPEGK